MRKHKPPGRSEAVFQGPDGMKARCDYKRILSATNRDSLVERPYLTLHESEIRIPAGLSARAGHRETGGDLWGWYTRAGRPIIQLITGPGPKAIHQSVHYAQDLDYFKELHNQLSTTFGCQWLGTWHFHHNLGLREPSSGDVQQVMAVTKRNGLDRWCEFITTFDSDESHTPSAYRHGRSLPMRDANRIRVDAYDYLEPQTGQSVNARIRLLPGTSPLRLALLHSHTVATHALAEEGILFPLSHVLYDPYEEDTACIESDECLEELSRQCAELPEKVQESIQFDIEDHTLSVSVRLPQGAALVVRYARTIPLKLVAVSLEDDETGGKQDLIKAIKKSCRQPTLQQLCEFVARSIVEADDKRPDRTKTHSRFTV